MIEDKNKDFKISDSVMANKLFSCELENDNFKGTFTETLSVEKLVSLMGWREIPKLAKKSYTYDMRKILGQLTKKELRNKTKKEANDLKVKRGKAKIRKLMERAV